MVFAENWKSSDSFFFSEQLRFIRILALVKWRRKHVQRNGNQILKSNGMGGLSTQSNLCTGGLIAANLRTGAAATHRQLHADLRPVQKLHSACQDGLVSACCGNVDHGPSRRRCGSMDPSDRGSGGVPATAGPASSAAAAVPLLHVAANRATSERPPQKPHHLGRIDVPPLAAGRSAAVAVLGATELQRPRSERLLNRTPPRARSLR